MVSYLSLKDYSERTGRSIASVYRDAEKGVVRTTLINGKKHIIIEDDALQDKPQKNNNDNEKIEYSHPDNNDKGYQEAEIIEDPPSFRYEIDIFKSSISTIEDMASRLEAAKDETINNLKLDIEKKDKIIDNQNEIIKTLSNDNSDLRTQLGIRDAETKILENRMREVEDEKRFLVERVENYEKMNSDNNKGGFWLSPRKL